MTDPVVLNRNGLEHVGRKHWDKALRCFDEALAIKPDYPEALTNRGNVLHRLKRLDEALASYEKALAVRPDFAQAFNNCGNVLIDLGQYEEALASFDQAIATKPDYAQAWSNRGNALLELGRQQESLKSHDRAIEINPDHAEAHFNRGVCRLVLGDLEGGWQDYEWRWQVPDFAPSRRTFAQPQWQGKESVAGKTLLLHAEQGLGDTIQFSRYASVLADMGAEIILEVQQPLASLLSQIRGVHDVIWQDGPQPKADFHCALMSVPLALRTRLETIPSNIPYLKPSPAALEKWQGVLGHGGELPRVGIVWSGAAANRRDSKRSIVLSKLLSLAESGVHLISLQKELRDGDSQLLERAKIRHFGAELRDFSDTAALVSVMDLVISVDTSIAHLAGALGKPVWVLLPLAPDWRWLLGRQDTPWYPTARLFRQTQRGDWDGVVNDVKRALKTWKSEQARSKATNPNPESALSKHSRGISLLREGKLKQAIAILRKAVKDDATIAELHRDLAEAYMQNSQFRDALASYLEATRLDPTDALAWEGAASALREAGDITGARKHFQRALWLRARKALLAPLVALRRMF